MLASRKRERAPKPDRSDEFRSFVPRPRAPAVMATALHAREPAPVEPKVQGRVNHAIRRSAKGEDCLMLLPGCPRDPERTIWSHNRHGRAGKGGGLKALDLNGCYACTHCDAIYDGQAPLPAGMTRDDVDLAFYRAHDRSLVKLAQKGLA